jgi:SAM-dependent methyltransferase
MNTPAERLGHLPNLSYLANGVSNDALQFADNRPVPGDDYNQLPYPSLAYGFTQPAHLAALATLHGIEAPAVERARVLEIGGASGGNMIALAARFPQASFLGVDLSTRHIADGNQHIARLGLKNIELRQADVTTLEFAGQPFDYIICHGVFSWVSQAAQAAIMRICGAALAPDGMAIISYNVLPGWHLRGIVRDICLHHAGRDGTPQVRVARARKALEHIAQTASDSQPYGKLLRVEAKGLAQRPAAYILGEFLAETNTPLYFHDFVEQAARHGLGFLCEADLDASTPRIATPAVCERIKSLAGEDRDAFEQNADFVTGRTFRRSILVRAARAGGTRSADPLRLRRLHFSAPLQLDEAQSTAQLCVYKDARGRHIRAEDGAVRRALHLLAQRYPSTHTLEELVADDAQSEARVCEALLLLVGAGQVDASSLPLVAGRADSERPCVWPHARLEAAGGQRWISSQRHASVAVNPVVSVLLPHIDGSNDCAALATRLCAALRRKEIAVPELRADEAPWAQARVREVAAQYVHSTIGYLAANALLEAEPRAGTARPDRSA